MKLVRRDGWESRLAAVFAGARGRPYVLGEWDCLRLALAAVEALTGTDLWPRFVGYRTRREALLVIARIAPSLGEAVTATFGVSPAPTLSAWRGDLVLYRDAAGEDHLGVVAGARVVLMLDTGTAQVPLLDPGVICAWRIG